MPTRRNLLWSLAATTAFLPRLGHTATSAVELQLTPACADADDLTIAQTEGPYFKPRSPQKRDFAADAPSGERITIAGYVLTQKCQPVANALIELWQADDKGAYDNTGFRLRGHQFSDAEGRWWFDTIVPGLYPGRTRHFHLKVQRPTGRVLTTQLYFPNEAANRRDGIFNAALVLDITTRGNGKFGRFDFVVA